jgi:hypothetical protein
VPGCGLVSIECARYRWLHTWGRFSGVAVDAEYLAETISARRRVAVNDNPARAAS